MTPIGDVQHHTHLSAKVVILDETFNGDDYYTSPSSDVDSLKKNKDASLYSEGHDSIKALYEQDDSTHYEGGRNTLHKDRNKYITPIGEQLFRLRAP